MKNTKRALLHSIIALLLCVAQLLGTTFAWFTDSVTSTQNIIKSGNLDLEMYWTDDLESGVWYDVEDDAHNTIFGHDNWEPGYTEVRYIKIINKGDLAFNYDVTLAPKGAVGKLAEVINVYFMEDVDKNISTREELLGYTTAGPLSIVMNGGKVAHGTLLPAGETSTEHKTESTVLAIGMTMLTTAGNEYQNETVGDFTIKALATQLTYEKDSFGEDYDKDAAPVVVGPSSGSVTVNGTLPTEGVTIDAGNGVSASVPGDVVLESGADKLTLSVYPKDKSDSNITVDSGEHLTALDVHIEGVADTNTKPITVELGKVLPEGLNMGNYTLAHVENGVTNPMTYVAAGDPFTAHNQFKYDPATGNVTIYIATFSEIAVVSETDSAWKGNFDYSWYTNAVAVAAADGEADYVIANADQLAAFGAIVGGMDGQTQYSFAGETVKLVADINLGDDEENNNPGIIFYPIGYYNSTGSYKKESGGSVTSSVSSFEGTFDGNGHTIANFYQNTWEMFGDYNSGYTGTPNYYCDAMGLFGYVFNGTVKNLTVKNFSSDGEFTPTGVIAAYADNSTFENISIFECNPRVYNTGNGGIIGIAGRSNEAVEAITLTNITVDNSNKISALWGSYDVACGGLVGMYRGNVDGSGNATGDSISFNNCHVAAQMDVYNDVCGNYQYYAYRYAGMIIGSIRHNTKNTEGKTIPNMAGISATGCTVNYGDWNDYYYCEFEKNGHPSYSGPDDYKFSRVPHSELNFTDSNGNGLVDADERASVTGCKHDHTAKENNQAIYLPFHQLFTGYSWGVSSIGLKEYSGIVTNLDITEGDQEESVDKFEYIGFDDYCFNTISYEIGELFQAKADLDVAINNSNVQVFVSPVGEESTVSAVYNPDKSDWTKGTLVFSGYGQATITITDYQMCKLCTVTIDDIRDPEPETKFKKIFDGDFLYRVGNQNIVSLSSLFVDEGDNRISIKKGNVAVSVEPVSGNATGAFTSNETWSNGTVKFSGTGVVKVTVTDNYYCVPTELYLEVVDATNIVSYSNLNDGQNSVFLNNITMSSGGTYRLTGNHILYGNNFTFDVTKGAYSGVQYDYASYVIYLEDSRLDNVQIKGAVYPSVGSTKTENYYRAIVMTGGNCSIINSFISNGASPIRNGGNLELVNTTLMGGIYANMDIRNGHVILDNVTTVNQIGANEKYNDTTEIVGMGIVVYQEGGTDDLKITIKNSLTQYNYLSQTQANEHLTSTYQTAIKNVVFGNDFENYQNNGLVNFGIISMNSYITAEDIVDERDDNLGYFGTPKTLTVLTQTRDCYVYSFRPAQSEAVAYPGYTSCGQGIIKPSVDFDFTTKNYQAKTENSNDYCYADNGKVLIGMDEGDTFNWDTSILTATKNGNVLEYEVTVDGIDYTGKSIAFNESGDHIVTYAYADPYNYTISNNEVTTFSKSYTESVNINVSVVKASAKNAVFSFGANGTAYDGKSVLIGDKTYVMPDVTATVSGKIGSTTVSGTTVYYPITEMYTSDGKTEHTGSWYACFPIFKDAVQIIDYADQGTGDSVTYNQEKVTTVAGIPSTLKATNPTSAFLYSMNATNYPPPTDPTAVSGAVCYTCNRNGLTSSNERIEMTIIAEYTYTDNAGKVYYYYVGYHCAAQTKGSVSPCVTPDTLVTLADGSQKRIDAITYEDELLVWDFYKGDYAVAPSAIIFDHGYDDNTVIKLNFSDGTQVKAVNIHQFFDADLNMLVSIEEESVKDYVGHRFVKQSAEGYTTVTLDSYEVSREYEGAYGIISAGHYNIFVEGVLSADFEKKDFDLFNYFTVGEGMKFDKAQMEEDIAKYGLYTYEDFADHLTYEQFEAFNVPYMKVAVGKGNYTYEGILNLIDEYLK